MRAFAAWPYLHRMRIIALAAIALLLTGCVQAAPVVTAAPTPHSTPLFSSDEAALKAAEDAYAAYLKVSDQILADGGANPERIEQVATHSVFEQQKAGFSNFVDRGYKSIGMTKFDKISLQEYRPRSPEGKGVISIYVCTDVSDVDVLDQSGRSVVSASRPDRTPFEVGFDWEVDKKVLIVSSKDAWSGTDFCN